MSVITITSPEPVLYGGNVVEHVGETVNYRTLQVPDYLLNDTLAIEDAIDSRSTASFRAFFEDGVNDFILGDQIKIASDGIVLFGGLVDGLREREDELGRVWAEVRAVDYTALLDRHVVSAAYENETADAIIEDILTSASVSTLNEERITSLGVQAGPVIPKLVINYQKASEVLNELATFAGYTWTVTPDKDLVFKPRDASPAPFAIADAGSNYRRLRVLREKAEYRNRQYLRAGKDLTSSRTETFKGDGELRAFTLAFPVGTVPTIMVNAVAKTVGIRGLESGKDFYWQKEDRTISQEDGAVRLTSSDTLSVTYQGLFPIIVVADNPAEKTIRALQEGTSGVYASVAQDATIDDRDNAKVKAEALLARYGSFQNGIEIELDDQLEANVLTLDVGDLITITKPAHGLDASECLVESVRLRFEGDTIWRATVRALTGTQTVSWLRYWKNLAADQQGLTVRENEVVVLGGDTTTFTDTVALTESFTPTAAGPETRAGFATVDFSEAG